MAVKPFSDAADTLIKCSCCLITICVLVWFIALAMGNTVCDDVYLCHNAQNGSVIYEGIMSRCTAKPLETWHCEWFVDQPCPVFVRCDDMHRHNILAGVQWTAFVIGSICVILMCVACCIEPHYDKRSVPNDTSSGTDLTVLVVPTTTPAPTYAAVETPSNNNDDAEDHDD